ncbi:MAG: hypothetical protein EOP05_12765 [Proteobacteria bacterium]|nr:MAG: hypothetical protein EOP05_12765 [Pseudomonadota bacterium]
MRESGIDSGRYTVRPSRAETQRPEKPIRRTAPETQSVEVTQEVRIETPTPVATPIVVATPAPAPIQIPEATPVAIEQKPSAPVVVANPVPTPVVDERRSVMLELSLAPGYMYNDSKSQFTNRNYSLHSPVLGVDANVWFSQSFGLHAGFLGTSNASVSDSLDRQRSVSVTEQWFKAGLRARKFFGSTALAPILTFGLDYQDYQVRVPSDSQLRAKLSSTGPVVSLESSHSVEKNVFNGDTSVPDVVTGEVQHGVSITNTTTIFSIGYTWSD